MGGRFELRGELGRGGMGVVYRALDRTIGREVALKVVQQGFADAESRARFEREGQLTAALRHSNIVAVHSAGEVEGRPFIAYELVFGAQPLDRVLAKLDLPARVAMIRDVARALGHAHAHGIVHRDVKPPNVLVDDAGRPRVSDFGLATAAGLGKLTQTGEVMGTPNYMSPEQLKGDAAVGPPTDVWALGGILYRALTDEPPFAGSSFFQLAGRVLQGDPPRPPRSINPAVPRAIEAVCLACLRRDPAERPKDGEELARRLDEALQGRGAPARGKTMMFAALGVVAALVVAGAAWLATPKHDAGVAAVVTTSGRPRRTTKLPPTTTAPKPAVIAPAADPSDYQPPRPRSLSIEDLADLESGEDTRVLATAQRIIERSSDPHERAYAMLRSMPFYPEAMADLGKLLMYGQEPSFPRNAAAARRWLERAVEAGAIKSSLRLLAELHLDGPAGIRDLDLAVAWAERALAERGSESAEGILGAALSDPAYPRRDPLRAARFLQRAAQEGHLGSRVRLEELHVRGDLPDDDPSLSFAPWSVAMPVDYPADLRALHASADVAAIYSAGDALAVPDPLRAGPLLARAFELGHADAGMLLGKTLVETDPDGALELMLRAVAADSKVGILPLNRMRTMAIFRLQDPFRARFWAREAARRSKQPVVLLLLGDLLLLEPVVDRKGARRAYEAAAALGDDDAILKLGALGD